MANPDDMFIPGATYGEGASQPERLARGSTAKGVTHPNLEPLKGQGKDEVKFKAKDKAKREPKDK